MRWYAAAALTTLVGCGPDVTNGEALYGQTCETCHGANGDAGVATNGVPAADLNEVVPSRSDAELTSVILDGIRQMPAQPLTDNDAKDVIAYLRQQFGGSS